ncbi:mRNA cleavage and polyadenylation factor CLP1 [Parachaetomium inaequale]|uniref:Polynucleotide 5'-hydroxyl-kinase GRC3 n=1 Tax=Parachaetomium inaequale TaxID=2588326 RepID=A0AAN6PN99_9PEZI|nr:mRNA cleavage and polyadenylation factor CLP1 [Parachaetomium inaequale]
MAGSRELPNHADLQPYNHAVAGHDGTLSDIDGELFIKPCVQQEIDFYETTFQDHLDFASLMPLFFGTLALNDVTDVESLNEQLPGVADHMSQGLKEEAILMAKAAVAEAAAEQAPVDIAWKPNKNRRIPTNKSVVLQNATHGFKKPNILDAKLGRRLWADDAPMEKRKRFDEISRLTTNGSHGFRVAGMRVYKGSDKPEELDADDFKVYNKDYGRFEVNKDNITHELRKFIFNERAGIDQDLGRAVAQAFLADLKRVEEVLASSETRMYSASLLFTFEGDGEALRAAIEENNAIVDDLKQENGEEIGEIELTQEKVAEIDEDDDDELSSLPRIYSLKLIDFAHAEWVPGQGPDENSLLGVRSLIKIFEDTTGGQLPGHILQYFTLLHEVAKMSIPGLGQIAPQQPTTASTTRTITLRPFWEWRFQVPRSAPADAGAGGATVRLASGTAERDGTELALNRTYTFPRNTQSRLLTYTGATLEVSGEWCADRVAQYAAPEHSPQLQVLNLHFALQEMRAKAKGGNGGGVPGPRVLVCGEKDSGKTTVARTLAALATRAGGQPVVGSVDPREGMLALPGTDPAAGAVPVKLPMVYYFGRERVEEDERLAKFAADEVVREAGLVLDTPAASVAKGDMEVLTHVVNQFAVNIVVVLGSAEMHAELQRRLGNERTAHGEAITLILLDKSDGVAERDRDFMKFTREAAIKEYFFGDAKRTLSPFTQSVGFDDVAIFKAPDGSDVYDNQPALEPAEISAEMSHWTLAVMNASVNDPPETIRQAPVMGFVAIADVDEERRRLKILSPVSGRLGNRPMVWGRWPEPYINLLG